MGAGRLERLAGLVERPLFEAAADVDGRRAGAGAHAARPVLLVEEVVEADSDVLVAVRVRVRDVVREHAGSRAARPAAARVVRADHDEVVVAGLGLREDLGDDGPAADLHLARDGQAAEGDEALLEVRGLGIVRVEALAEAPLALIVDLVAPQDVERMPEPYSETVFGLSIPIVEVAPFEASAAAKLRFALAALTDGGTGPITMP